MAIKFSLLSAGMLWLTVLTSTSAAGSKPSDVGDHLVTIETEPHEDGVQQTYRELWQRLLFVTPGDLARYVFLPGMVGEEASVSVYRLNGKGRPNVRGITVTSASRRIWSIAPASKQAHGDRSEPISISRTDATIPERTALAVHSAWIAMLRSAKPPRKEIVILESSSEIFSAKDEEGRLLRAKIGPQIGPRVNRLLGLVELLSKYASVDSAARPGLAEKIRINAIDLREEASGKVE